MDLPAPYRPDLRTYLGCASPFFLPTALLCRPLQSAAVGILCQDVTLLVVEAAPSGYRRPEARMTVGRMTAPTEILRSLCTTASPWTNAGLSFDWPTPEFGPVPRFLILPLVSAWSVTSWQEARGMSIWETAQLAASCFIPAPEMERRVRPILRQAAG